MPQSACDARPSQFRICTVFATCASQSGADTDMQHRSQTKQSRCRLQHNPRSLSAESGMCGQRGGASAGLIRSVEGDAAPFICLTGPDMFETPVLAKVH